ncbi:pentatricopeptide repeat-containing protein At1g06710, mitochondrial [Impatiens glandulifera]|uniref:pentatricopeptide repeat-containing protein At1g06710, mitochondrial n=1 Tax=Impatiens glandulifera TaxID=253017 RepID=UPI001FB10C1E|nr:pentatricopeptide repeat-containing protein At1g06710, mitochondrial [Impatiens glandulifera]
MSRRGLRLALSVGSSRSDYLHSHSRPTPFSSHSSTFARQLFLCFPRFISDSSPDNLEGLIHPDLHLPGEEQSGSDGRFRSDGYAFLRDSLMGSVAECSHSEEKLESCKSSTDAVLMSNAIKNSTDGFGIGTQNFLRQFRGKLNEALAVDVLKLIKNADLGVKFFLWVGRQIGYQHTLPVYNALIELIGCERNNKMPDHLVREIKDDDEVLLVKLLNLMIRNFCKNGMWNIALEELGRLKDLGYTPSRGTYNCLIQVFLKAERLDTAYLVYREMSEKGFRMDDQTMGCYVHTQCRAGKWREALDLIEKEKIGPNTVIYTTMISGLCEASLFKEAMEIMNIMRVNSCVPNVITYRTLLCGCLNKKQLSRCKRIVKMMITEGCYPSPKLFNSLVHAYCQSRDYSYAYKLIKKMLACDCKPGYVVYNIFVGGICGNEELPSSDALELAEIAYSEMFASGLTLNKVNVVSFARCLCSAGKFEKSYKIIHEMMKKGFVPDSSTYSKVIGFLCHASKIEKAFLLFEEMKRNGVTPDIYTYTILIDSFCKAGLIQQARNLLDEMRKAGSIPNVVTYTALIHGYLKAMKIMDANELFLSMLSEGCMPNVVTYSALIDGLCKAGHLERACQIYERMRGNKGISDVNLYFVGDESGGEPNVITYGALVDGLCKAHKVEEARNLLDAMSAAGCEPNHIVFDALIDGFCKAGKLDEAREFFYKMSEYGYSPNIYTYSSILDKLFKDKKIEMALDVISNMLDNSCPPNVIVYTEMIDGLCKSGKTNEAFKLMNMMEEKGCNPNVVTYTAMIDGYGKIGEVDKCIEILRQMSDKGCAPNHVTYHVLIKHCCANGLLDEAYQLLKEMKQTYWPINVTNYCKVIEGFSQDFIANLGLLDEIGKTYSLAFSSVYSILIDSFCKAGRLEVALELYREISNSQVCSSAERKLYSSLIESLSLSCKIDRAFELYSDMIRKGGIPDLSIFFHLIKGLANANMWEEALQLSDSLCHMDIVWVSSEAALKDA